MANTEPNLYEVHGHGIHVTYSTTSITGKPLFNYHDAAQTKNFSGDQIQVGSLGGCTIPQAAKSISTDAGMRGQSRVRAAIPSANCSAVSRRVSGP